jgi:hypothetical protein
MLMHDVAESESRLQPVNVSRVNFKFKEDFMKKVSIICVSFLSACKDELSFESVESGRGHTNIN